MNNGTAVMELLSRGRGPTATKATVIKTDMTAFSVDLDPKMLNPDSDELMKWVKPIIAAPGEKWFMPEFVQIGVCRAKGGCSGELFPCTMLINENGHALSLDFNYIATLLYLEVSRQHEGIPKTSHRGFAFPHVIVGNAVLLNGSLP